MADLFTPHATTLACIAALATISAVQNVIAGALKNGIGGQPAGQRVAGDMNSFAFRAVRTHQNGMENLPAYFATAFAAILVGVDATMLGWGALAVLVSRLLYWAVYYIGIGDAGFGPRSVLYIVTPLASIMAGAQALMAILST